MQDDNKEMLVKEEMVLSQQEVDSVVSPENFVGSGIDMMTFRMGEDVLQVPYYNVLGKDKTLDVLLKISDIEDLDEGEQMRLANMALAVRKLNEQEYLDRVGLAKSRLKSRVDRQNLFYAETVRKSLVVNDRGKRYFLTSVPARVAILEEPGNTFGVIMEFVEGDHPNTTEHPELVSILRKLQPDWHTNNAFIQESHEVGNIEVILIDF